MLTKTFLNSLIKDRQEQIKKAQKQLFLDIYSIDYKQYLVKKIKLHKQAIYRYSYNLN